MDSAAVALPSQQFIGSQAMRLDYGLATLTNVKDVLGISAEQTVHDSVLQSIVNNVSATIERAAGRPLLRDHSRIEIFPGGNKQIRVGAFPIVEVHSIRESSTRDFDDSDNYTELVEGTDYVIEAGSDGLEGSSGVIRRLNGDWLGSKNSPGQVQVRYTGGYKTDEESDLENTSVTLNSTALVDDFSVQSSSDVLGNASHSISLASGDTISVWTDIVAFTRFATDRTGGIILPSWAIDSAVFTYKYRSVGVVESAIFDVYLITDQDPLLGTPTALHTAASAGTFLKRITSTSEDWGSHVVTLGDALRASLLDSILGGYIAFSFVIYLAGPEATEIGAVEAGTSTGPQLVVSHRRNTADRFTMQDDLRNACIIQSIHEWNNRRKPGLLTSSMRGVAVASGASVQKRAARLLPEVAEVARSYRRQY